MYYTPDGFFEHASQVSVVRRSFDGGRSWPEEFEMAGTRGRLVQPSVVRLRSGRLKAFFRDRNARHIFTSESSDEGRSWSPPERTALPSNNSGLQALSLRDGRLLLLFNNVRGRAHRWPLTAALSMDDGRSWPHLRDLEPDFHLGMGLPARAEDGEYSYPAVAQGEDGAIHVAYTFRRDAIRYVRLPTPDWVMVGTTTGRHPEEAPRDGEGGAGAVGDVLEQSDEDDLDSSGAGAQQLQRLRGRRRGAE